MAKELISADERTEEEEVVADLHSDIWMQAELSLFLYFLSIPAVSLPSASLSLSSRAPFRLNGCLIRAVITLIWCRAISTRCPSPPPSSPPSTLQ